MRLYQMTLAVIILLAAGFLLFWNLGATSFHNWDEARFAQSGREMVESGEYLTVRYHGEPYLEKPPGKIWLITLGYRIFGVNELGARFTSALFALGTVALTMLLGRAVFGTAAGLLAAAILLSSTQFIHEHCGRTAECEPEIAFLYVLSMLCLWNLGRGHRWFYGLAVCLGLLVMLKGPIALPVVAVAVLYLVLTGVRRVLNPRAGLIGLLIILGIALPWHVHQLVTHGGPFVRTYLGAHIIGRLTGHPPQDLAHTVGGIRSGLQMDFYPRVIFDSLFPWSVLLLPALLGLARSVLREARGERLLLLWIAVYGLTITIARGKLPSYAVPVLPGLALTTSWFCVGMYRWISARWAVLLGVGALLAVVIVVPSLEYDPYSRLSSYWPFLGPGDPSVIPVWKLKTPHVAALVPLLVTLLFAVGIPVYLRARSRIRGWNIQTSQSTVCAVLVASFLFYSVYQTALPLGGTDRKVDLVECREMLRAGNLQVSQVLLMGDQITERLASPLDYFYLYDLAGGRTGRIFSCEGFTDPALHETMGREGTLILSDTHWRWRLPVLRNTVPVCSGRRFDASYVGADQVPGAADRMAAVPVTECLTPDVPDRMAAIAATQCLTLAHQTRQD